MRAGIGRGAEVEDSDDKRIFEAVESVGELSRILSSIVIFSYIYTL